MSVQAKPISPTDACPCGGVAYARCCGPLHAGEAVPATAEQLMRSRYSAYVLGLTDHLRATWHPSTCPADLAPDPGTRWLGLEVRSHRTLDADHAEVDFVARYRVQGRGGRLQERSRFVREDGRWLYVDGDVG